MYWTSLICNSHPPWSIQLIQPFMISLQDKRERKKEDVVVLSSSIIEKTIPVEPAILTTIPTIPTIPIPTPIQKQMSVKKTQDPLFWTLFLVKYGESEYKRAFNMLNSEIKEKKRVAEHFYSLLKATSDLSIKVTKKGCNRIVEDILTQPKLLLSSLYAFCHYYRFNIYIVDKKKKTYLEFLLDKHEQFESVILYRKEDKKIPEYLVDIPTPSAETQAQSLTNIRESLVGLISFEKSLKSVSNYKLCELQHMYSQLGMTDPPKKKHDLYEKIVVHCVWE